MQGAVSSILPPDTTAISHSADVSLTYQFGQNEMIGTKAALSGLWYPNRAHLDGLSDSTAAGNEIFYAHRISGNHYLGATYGFRKLFTHPGRVETQSQNSLLFYTFYLPPTLSLSFFAGPEYSITSGATTLPLRTWSPAWGRAWAGIVATPAYWQVTHRKSMTAAVCRERSARIVPRLPYVGDSPGRSPQMWEGRTSPTVFWIRGCCREREGIPGPGRRLSRASLRGTSRNADRVHTA